MDRSFHGERRLTMEDMAELNVLHGLYKQEIGEEQPGPKELGHLHGAIAQGDIAFYGAFEDGRLVGICSVCVCFSTFCYGACGVLEDFYILPAYRHRGIARRLVAYAYRASGVQSMTVGCAECDRAMYQAIGFDCPIGTLLAYSPRG